MNKQTQSYSPTVMPVRYDSLHAANGCLSTYGTRTGTAILIDTVCIFDSIEDDPLGFTKADDISYFRGPEDELSPAHPFLQQWAAWVATSGIRYGLMPYNQEPSGLSGFDAEMFGVLKPSRITASFNYSAYLHIATEVSSSIVIKSQTESDAFFSITFAGKSPVLFYTGLLLGSEDGGEIVCYYLKEGRRYIYTRIESEGFAVERVALLNTVVDIETLISARPNGRLMELLATDTFNRSLIYKSKAYPAEETDRSASTMEILSGVSFEMAVSESDGDEGTLSIEMGNGVVSEPLESITLTPDEEAVSITLVSGNVTTA